MREAGDPAPCRVFIDGCAVNRFALLNVDPAKALAGTGFRLAITAALEAEYRAAMNHLFVPSYVKVLLGHLRTTSERVADPSPGGADRQLLDLSRDSIVITDDARLHRGASHPGMIGWPDVEAHLRADKTLVCLLRDRARLMARA